MPFLGGYELGGYELGGAKKRKTKKTKTVKRQVQESEVSHLTEKEKKLYKAEMSKIRAKYPKKSLQARRHMALESIGVHKKHGHELKFLESRLHHKNAGIAHRGGHKIENLSMAEKKKLSHLLSMIGLGYAAY